MNVTTVMLCGVGGQGTILAADLLAKVALSEGFDVKLSEVHGMAQRGGGVDTVVRFGDVVHSPVTDPGCVDRLVGFEMTEALRRAHFVKADGRFFVNRMTIQPLPVLIGDAPPPAGVEDALAALGSVFIDADTLACEAGSPKSANVVLMGALSTGLPFGVDSWRATIGKRVPPKTVEANLLAFELGRKACDRGSCEL